MPAVLIASDSPSVIDSVRSVVDEAGTRVQTVFSGRAVLAAVQASMPDLVVLDLQIGSMGGIAVCHDLRLEEGAGRLERVPVLMLLDRRPDVFLAKRSGADGWLLKPLDPLRLRRAVQSLLSGGSYEDPTRAPTGLGSPTLG